MSCKLLNVLKKVEEAIKCEAGRAFYSVFTTKLINSIIQKQDVRLFISYDTKIT